MCNITLNIFYKLGESKIFYKLRELINNTLYELYHIFNNNIIEFKLNVLGLLSLNVFNIPRISFEGHSKEIQVMKKQFNIFYIISMRYLTYLHLIY